MMGEGASQMESWKVHLKEKKKKTGKKEDEVENQPVGDLVGGEGKAVSLPQTEPGNSSCPMALVRGCLQPFPLGCFSELSEPRDGSEQEPKDEIKDISEV